MPDVLEKQPDSFQINKNIQTKRGRIIPASLFCIRFFVLAVK